MPETGTILELHEKVRDIELSNRIIKSRILCHAAIYKDTDGYKQLGLILIDRNFDEPKKYANHFNIDWCDEKYQDWLANVLIRQMADLIIESHNALVNELQKPAKKILKMLHF